MLVWPGKVKELEEQLSAAESAGTRSAHDESSATPADESPGVVQELQETIETLQQESRCLQCFLFVVWSSCHVQLFPEHPVHIRRTTANWPDQILLIGKRAFMNYQNLNLWPGKIFPSAADLCPLVLPCSRLQAG